MTSLEQNPAAAPPCAEPTGMVKPDQPEFLCQRGRRHPGPHEVMLAHGARMTWGDSDVMEADRRADDDEENADHG